MEPLIAPGGPGKLINALSSGPPAQAALHQLLSDTGQNKLKRLKNAPAKPKQVKLAAHEPKRQRRPK